MSPYPSSAYGPNASKQDKRLADSQRKAGESFVWLCRDVALSIVVALVFCVIEWMIN